MTRPLAGCISYTIRNDPADPNAVGYLRRKLQESRFQPAAFVFWTKNPEGLARMYERDIKEMQDAGTVVLAQVTRNHGYDKVEPGIDHSLLRMSSLQPLIDLLGGPKAVRLRFDPIIPGYTKPMWVQDTIVDAIRYGIYYVTFNFIVTGYGKVLPRLRQVGIVPEVWDSEQKVDFLRVLSCNFDEFEYAKVIKAVCAENAHLVRLMPELKMAACVDPQWLKDMGCDHFVSKGNRPGCGCATTADWGAYASAGGWKCPHQCLYCYARKD